MNKIIVLALLLGCASTVFAGKEAKESVTVSRNQCYNNLPFPNRCGGTLYDKLSSSFGTSQTSFFLCGRINNDPKKQCGMGVIISMSDLE